MGYQQLSMIWAVVMCLCKESYMGDSLRLASLEAVVSKLDQMSVKVITAMNIYIYATLHLLNLQAFCTPTRKPNIHKDTAHVQ